MRTQCLIGLTLALILGGLAAGCSTRNSEAHKSISLATGGTLEATFDRQRRVQSFRQFNPDQSLKLSVAIVYIRRDIERLQVFDSKGREVCRSVFTSNSESSTGRGSDETSPGWDIRTEGNWSGMPGDIHDTISWFCGDDLLYRLKRTWPDDRSRVYYEVAGPSGVILFTNTYFVR
jgi:hypothetical protein